MGPTNVALVKLFRADQALRESQERLDAATKNVRIQERKTNDLAERLKLASSKHRELQARGANLDLDMRSRDVQIEKLRTQQQIAKNNKEYQAFLVEINTQKVDRAKVEEDAMKVLEQTEAAGKESVELQTMLDAERAKLTQMKSQMSATIAKLQAEIDSLKAPREAAAAALPKKARDVFDRLAEHHDGEAMSALMKPDRRKEEYVCSSCMMDLVTDVYNRLHTRDEMVFCPSCRRILYIPDELPPELAVHVKGGRKAEPATKHPIVTEEDFFAQVDSLNSPDLRGGQDRLLSVLRSHADDGVQVTFDARGDSEATYNVRVAGIRRELLRVNANGSIFVNWDGFKEVKAVEFVREQFAQFVKEPTSGHGSHTGENFNVAKLHIESFMDAVLAVAGRIKEAPRARGKIGQLLTAAQGESVKNAVDADQQPLEFQVSVDGKVAGVYKGKSAENLERIIKYRMEESHLTHAIQVAPAHVEPAAAQSQPVSEPVTDPSTESSTDPAAEAPSESSPANA